MSSHPLSATLEQLAPTTRPPEEHARVRQLSPAEKKLRLINLGAVLVPLGGLALAIVLAWGSAFDWTQATISLSMSFCTAIGVTVGYHRLFTHKSFVAVAPVRWLLAVFGSMAVQGPVIEWAGTHRRHHQHSDDEHDPHSPHNHADEWGDGFIGTVRGFWHSHIGWLFRGRPKG